MAKINSIQIIADYQAAYLAANKKSLTDVDFYFKNGWFVLHGSRYRANDIKSFTGKLNFRALRDSQPSPVQP